MFVKPLNDMSSIRTNDSSLINSLLFAPKFRVPVRKQQPNFEKHSLLLTLCMETLQIINISPTEKPQFMTALFPKLNRKTLSTYPSYLKPFCTTTTPLPLTPVDITPSTPTVQTVVKASKIAVAAQLKENWLHSLTYPLPEKTTECPNCAGGSDLTSSNVDTNWAIGVDPDLSGALAVLKINGSGCSAEVFDAPHLKVMVGERLRKRLDAKSIVQLLQGIDAPTGTTAYIEQSIPFPKDGKQGWWSGGFGYGLWIGILVASGFSVVPVPSFTWKREFELTGDKCSKDDSRRIASTLFPSLSSSLRRKKDHGRAEALLIAAYGKGLKINSTAACAME